jgi:glycosyltransferase involved in cell wall biosynthesis
MINVLAICYEDPTNILGGMGRHVHELYRAMGARGDVKIDLLTTGSHEGSREVSPGFTAHYDNKLVCWKPQQPDIACRCIIDMQVAKTLTRLLAEGRRWDVVHQHEWTSVQIARMARDALGIPLIGTMHLCLSWLAHLEHPESNPADWGDADRYMMQQEGHLICDPNELILCSDAYVQMARSYFMTERVINTVPNGIDTTIWYPEAGNRDRARQQHQFEEDRPVALFVGRIAEMKGIVYVLDALEAEDPGWQVILCGEVNANTDEDKEGWEVTRRIRRLQSSHPERLQWVGFHQGQALRDLYAAADCVLMPSTHEPFGIVALEAMAMGVPLVSTEVDGLREIVCGSNGHSGDEYALIIPERDPQAILKGLQTARRSEVRRELRQLGLQRVADFDWHKIADDTVGIYKQAAAH